jgi:hypothetical protein
VPFHQDQPRQTAQETAAAAKIGMKLRSTEDSFLDVDAKKANPRLPSAVFVSQATLSWVADFNEGKILDFLISRKEEFRSLPMPISGSRKFTLRRIPNSTYDPAPLSSFAIPQCGILHDGVPIQADQ